MNTFNINYLLIIFLIFNIISGCSKIRKSAGVNRKMPDEFQVIENPSLIIPPNYNLVPPDQLQEKSIENIEKELAEEILFGLEEKDTAKHSQLTTMSKILAKANTESVSENIRDEIDESFSKELNINNDELLVWENETEVLDAVKEAELIREKNFTDESVIEEEVPIKKQKVKKKKKRFFFF